MIRPVAFVLGLTAVLALAAWGVGTAPAGPPGPPIEQALEAAVLEADRDIKTDADALDAARLIEGTVRARGERSADVAYLLPRLKNRSLAFRLALVLGRHLREPAVRSAMLGALERGANHSREVAAYSFYGVTGDPDAARALAAGFQDEKASPLVRAAHGFAVVKMLPDLPPAEREAVRATARRLAAKGGTGDVPLRAESVGLLDVTGADREMVRALLRDDPERNVGLAAARVLLRSGEDERWVGECLRRFASDAKDADLTSKSLHAILEGDSKP